MTGWLKNIHERYPNSERWFATQNSRLPNLSGKHHRMELLLFLYCLKWIMCNQLLFRIIMIIVIYEMLTTCISLSFYRYLRITISAEVFPYSLSLIFSFIYFCIVCLFALLFKYVLSTPYWLVFPSMVIHMSGIPHFYHGDVFR